MALNLGVLDEHELKPKITVFGVGGAGGNAVNNMINKNLEGADFVVANTDAQALEQSRATRRIQLGGNVTQGLGAGMRPEVGRESAEESIDEIIDQLSGANMCFITAGMGGGTGTGAAPVIAKAARELGVLTVGVVTKPFSFEGARRATLAEQGLSELQEYVDTLIIIPNQNLFRIATENTTIMDAFNLADDVLYQGVKGVTDLMVMPGLINLDFADVRTVMGEMGKAMMGTGEAEGEGRAVHAAEKAIANPLLDDVSLHGARGVLVNITGGYDLKLFEVDEAANRIKQEVDSSANIIVGSCFDENLEGMMRVSVVATGIEAEEEAETRQQESARTSTARPAQRRAYSVSRSNDGGGASQSQGGAAAIRPAQRHAVRRAVTSAPAASAAATAAVLDEEFDLDIDVSAMESPQADAVITPPQSELSLGDAPLPSPQAAAESLSIAEQPAPKAPIATVVDSSSVDSSTDHGPAPDADTRGLAAGGMSFIRRVADSFNRTEDAKTPPFRANRLDENEEAKDGQLQIPAFLRRQAN